MLMNCHYLVQQHLHLLTAEGDERSEFKHCNPMSPPWNFESLKYLLSWASVSASLACSICRWSSWFWNSWMPAAYMGKCSWTCRDSSHRLWYLNQQVCHKMNHPGCLELNVSHCCVFESRLQLRVVVKPHHFLVLTEICPCWKLALWSIIFVYILTNERITV